jgi:hypothetical protein
MSAKTVLLELQALTSKLIVLSDHGAHVGKAKNKIQRQQKAYQ